MSKPDQSERGLPPMRAFHLPDPGGFCSINFPMMGSVGTASAVDNVERSSLFSSSSPTGGPGGTGGGRSTFLGGASCMMDIKGGPSTGYWVKGRFDGTGC